MKGLALLTVVVESVEPMVDSVALDVNSDVEGDPSEAVVVVDDPVETSIMSTHFKDLNKNEFCSIWRYNQDVRS